MNLPLAATGLFILVVGLTGNYASGSVRAFAGRIVDNTVICESYLIILLFGAFVAARLGAWLRVPIMLASIALCLVAIMYDRQFSIVPQACWVLATRALPLRGEVPLSSDYVKRVRDFTSTSVICLLAQLILLVVLSSALVSVGIGTRINNTVTAPHWFYAFLWGAYYFELAFLLPIVAAEQNRD